ncbi:hypothetical protein ALC60_02040, partial [Trachymyrmex zeteki]
EKKGENREKTEKRTGAKRMRELARGRVSASVSKFSFGLKNVRRRAFGGSVRAYVESAESGSLHRGTSGAGAPEHEGVGLTPLGSKLATDWLAVYGAQLKRVRERRKRQRSGGTFYDRVFESCDSCVVCTSGLNS